VALDRSTVSYWSLRFLLGLLLLTLAGTGLLLKIAPIPDRIGLVRVLVGLLGFHYAYTAIGPLVRVVTRNARVRGEWHEAARNAFARASLPRRIWYLLASVAEADGPMSQEEREAVRHFVLERFVESVHAAELRAWESQPFPISDRSGLAARIGVGLDDTELDTLFCWCCLVAFADGTYAEPEHKALQEVAQGLGIKAGRARMLFHLARAQFLRGDRRGERNGPHPARPPAGDARAEALAVLDLPANATVEQIRKRHRELVRKFHPDAQPNLGPRAQQEATERFTTIQRAYETLTS